MDRLHEISVHGECISATLKFNQILKEYLFHKARYDRGVYGSAVLKKDLPAIRITCRLLYADLRELDPVRTLKEVPALKIQEA
jgi:hypothetical protein